MKEFLIKYRGYIVGIFICITVFIITHHQWFFSLGALTYADWQFYFSHSLKESWTLPYVWNRAGLGDVYFFLSFYPVQTLMGFVAAHGGSFGLAERIALMWPIGIMAAVASFVFLRHIVKSNVAAVIGSFLLCYNTYILIINISILTILMADAIFPLGIYLFMITLERKKVYLALLAGLTFTILSFYEFRIFYIFSFVIFFFAIYYFFYIQKVFTWKRFLTDSIFTIIPFLITFLLNFYWIDGLVHTTSLTHNKVFNQGLFGNEILKLQDAIALFHPFWTGGHVVFFQLHEVPFYFFLLPLLAFTGYYLNKKNNYVFFFTLIALLGIFLTKQSDTPFTTFYLFLYNHLPGFNAFREASKFYYLIALGYSVIISALLTTCIQYFKNSPRKIKIIGYIGIGLCAVFFLTPTIPLLNSSFGSLFVTRHVPSDYAVLEAFMQKQPDFFRTLWIPVDSRFGDYSMNHPKLSALAELQSDWSDFNTYQNVLSDDQFDFVQLLHEPIAPQLLSAANVKYVIVPIEDIANDDELYNNKDEHGSRAYFIQSLDDLPYLKRLSLGMKNLVVYQNTAILPGYFSAQNTGQIVFGDQTKPINASINACSQDTLAINNIPSSDVCKEYTYSAKQPQSFTFTFLYNGDIHTIINGTIAESNKTGEATSFTKLTNTQTIDGIIYYASSKHTYIKALRIDSLQQITTTPFANLANAQVLSYKVIDPTRYTITVKASNKPFLLSMSEAYNDHWSLASGKATIPSENHVVSFASMNAWKIDPSSICTKGSCIKQPDGSYIIKFTLTFPPQQNLEQGETVTIIAGILLLLLLITTIIKKV